MEHANEWVDNATLKGEILEGIWQTVFWAVVLTWVHKRLEKQFRGRPWYIRMEKHTGGTFEFLIGARVCVHHLTSGILAWIGYMMNDGYLVRHATLAEFGFETFDLVRHWYLFFANSLPLSDAYKNILAWTLHHLPGVLLIIPINLNQSDNQHFHKIVALLLGPAASTTFLMSLAKTYDTKKLGQRTKFTVVNVIS